MENRVCMGTFIFFRSLSLRVTTLIHITIILGIFPFYSWGLFFRDTGAAYEIDIGIRNARSAGSASVTPYVIDPAGATIAQSPFTLNGGDSTIITFTFPDPRQGSYNIIILVQGTSSDACSEVRLSKRKTKQKWTTPNSKKPTIFKYSSSVIKKQRLTLSEGKFGTLELDGFYTSQTVVTLP